VDSSILHSTCRLGEAARALIGCATRGAAVGLKIDARAAAVVTMGRAVSARGEGRIGEGLIEGGIRELGRARRVVLTSVFFFFFFVFSTFSW
jgi:hypothetical protein